jgi:hypothetical protein
MIGQVAHVEDLAQLGHFPGCASATDSFGVIDVGEEGLSFDGGFLGVISEDHWQGRC